MGYRGTVYVLQEIVNRLYEVLFNFLPVDAAYAQLRGRNGAGGPPAPPNGKPGNLPWQTAAKTRLDEALNKLPFLPRISASRELQMEVESLAHARDLPEVTPALVEEVLGKSAAAPDPEG